MQTNVRQEVVPPQGLALTVMAFAVFVSRKALILEAREYNYDVFKP